MKLLGIAIFGILAVAGCASSNVTALNSDTVLIQTRAAPACGRDGAQKVALDTAAIETLKRGYEKFLIVAADGSSNVGVIGYTPGYATTTTYGNATVYGNSIYGSATSNTFVSGGQPIIGGTHNQALTIKLLRNEQPGAENAFDPKFILGEEWQQRVADGAPGTCG